MNPIRLLVTAGPTREYIDSVRFISNASSGKMGFAIAEEASKRGHDVHLISGPVSLPEPQGVRLVKVVTAKEMWSASLSIFPSCDAAIMAAAVCDFRPIQRMDFKIAKTDLPSVLPVETTQDICAALGESKGHRVVVGFALEDRNPHENAQSKLIRKRCDAMILNRPDNVGHDEAKVQFLRVGSSWQPPIRGPKRLIASRIVDLVEELVQKARKDFTS